MTPVIDRELLVSSWAGIRQVTPGQLQNDDDVGVVRRDRARAGQDPSPGFRSGTRPETSVLCHPAEVLNDRFPWPRLDLPTKVVGLDRPKVRSLVEQPMGVCSVGMLTQRVTA